MKSLSPAMRVRVGLGGCPDRQRVGVRARTVLTPLVSTIVIVGTLTGQTVTAWASGAVHQRGLEVVRPAQQLAGLLNAHEAFDNPNQNSRPLQLIQAVRPLTRTRTVLPVLGRSTARNGTRWLRVPLVGRPNGRIGWIRQQDTLASWTSYNVVVSTTARKLTVYRFGQPVRSADVIVGKPSTPTPLGSYFVEEVIRMQSKAIGAPYAFALSARSSVLQEFDGGPGQIALHGLLNVGGVLGTAASHGCVRLDSATLAWMVTRIGPGVVVTIVS